MQPGSNKEGTKERRQTKNKLGDKRLDLLQMQKPVIVLVFVFY